MKKKKKDKRVKYPRRQMVCFQTKEGMTNLAKAADKSSHVR